MMLLTPLNPVYARAVSGLEAALTYRGVNPTQAHAGALRVLYNALLSQAEIQGLDQTQHGEEGYYWEVPA